MRLTWTAKVVGVLAECKALGYGFEQAWSEAVAEFPPLRRDMGVQRPTLFPEFPEDESPVEFLRRVCDDAWHGRRAALQHLAILLDDAGMLDAGGPFPTRGAARGRSRPAPLSPTSMAA